MRDLQWLDDLEANANLCEVDGRDCRLHPDRVRGLTLEIRVLTRQLEYMERVHKELVYAANALIAANKMIEGWEFRKA